MSAHQRIVLIRDFLCALLLALLVIGILGGAISYAVNRPAAPQTLDQELCAKTGSPLYCGAK